MQTYLSVRAKFKTNENYSMKLDEVLRISDLVKYEYSTVSKTPFKEVYQFILKDGQRFIVTFQMLSSPESEEIHDKLMDYVKIPERLYDQSIVAQIRQTLGSIYYVTFQDADKPEGSFEMTNKNKDMFYILGHTIKIIIDFANTHKILELSFAAESAETARVQVYDRLSKIIPKYTNLKKLPDDRSSTLVSYFFTTR